MQVVMQIFRCSADLSTETQEDYHLKKRELGVSDVLPRDWTSKNLRKAYQPESSIARSGPGESSRSAAAQAIDRRTCSVEGCPDSAKPRLSADFKKHAALHVPPSLTHPRNHTVFKCLCCEFWQVASALPEHVRDRSQSPRTSLTHHVPIRRNGIRQNRKNALATLLFRRIGLSVQTGADGTHRAHLLLLKIPYSDRLARHLPYLTVKERHCLAIARVANEDVRGDIEATSNAALNGAYSFDSNLMLR